MRVREAHAHLHWHARAMSLLRLDGCASVGECLELVGRAAGSLAPGAWLLGAGARVEAWEEGRWPTMEELDGVSGGRACALMSFDLHSVVVNRRGLELSRVIEAPVEGGVVCRGANGAPTGVLLEASAYQAWNAAPEPTMEQWRGLIPPALQDVARHGFTEVHDLFSPAWLGPMLAELERAGGLPMEVRLYAPLEDIEAEVERSRGYRSAGVRLVGAKLFADGTLNSRTAWMLHPYADPLPGMERGKVIAPVPRIEEAVRRTAALGLGLAVHAIGDGAVRAVLDACAACRHDRVDVSGVRIEHCELIDREDVVRVAELGVCASVQPCHLLADVEALRRHVPDRLDRVLPLRELIDAGLTPGDRLVFGSDTPVVRPDPGDSIQAAVHRRRAGYPASETIGAGQAISEGEAWACFGVPAGRGHHL